jgi:CTP:molybdopterin cytidylyltransferase MocA
MNTSFAFVLLHAGPGRQMQKLGPRAALRVGGEPLVHRQVRVLRECVPGAEVVVVIGHEAGRLQKALPTGVRVVENERWEETGTLRSVAIALRAAPGDVVVVYGDLLFDHAAILDLADRPGSFVLVGNPEPGAGVGVNEARGRAAYMDYGRPNQWLQMARLTAKAATTLVRTAEPADARPLLFHEGLNTVIDHGVVIRVARCSGRVEEIDTPADYRRVCGGR